MTVLNCDLNFFPCVRNIVASVSTKGIIRVIYVKVVLIDRLIDKLLAVSWVYMMTYNTDVLVGSKLGRVKCSDSMLGYL